MASTGTHDLKLDIVASTGTELFLVKLYIMASIGTELFFSNLTSYGLNRHSLFKT